MTVIADFDNVCCALVERYACCSVANELNHFLSGKRIDFGLCAFRTVDGYQAVGVTYRDVFGIYDIDSAGVIEGYGIDMLILGIYLEVVSFDCNGRNRLVYCNIDRCALTIGISRYLSIDGVCPVTV